MKKKFIKQKFEETYKMMQLFLQNQAYHRIYKTLSGLLTFYLYQSLCYIQKNFVLGNMIELLYLILINKQQIIIQAVTYIQVNQQLCLSFHKFLYIQGSNYFLFQQIFHSLLYLSEPCQTYIHALYCLIMDYIKAQKSREQPIRIIDNHIFKIINDLTKNLHVYKLFFFYHVSDIDLLYNQRTKNLIINTKFFMRFMYLKLKKFLKRDN
ncbi:hypothetical protein pb186bvf_012412 [Paramecium bursaria]